MKIQQPVFVSDKGEEGNQKVLTKQSKTEMEIPVLSIGRHRSSYLLLPDILRSNSCG
jgi:hypothetical protein